MRALQTASANRRTDFWDRPSRAWNSEISPERSGRGGDGVDVGDPWIRTEPLTPCGNVGLLAHFSRINSSRAASQRASSGRSLRFNSWSIMSPWGDAIRWFPPSALPIAFTERLSALMPPAWRCEVRTPERERHDPPLFAASCVGVLVWEPAAEGHTKAQGHQAELGRRVR